MKSLLQLRLRMGLPGMVLLLALLATTWPVAAFQEAQVEVLFTPGNKVADKMIRAIRHAEQQVLVQAFSFTHDGIARALLETHRRGVEVRLIADWGQTRLLDKGQVPGLARAGLPVWLDGEHMSAHNKVVIIDAGLPSAMVITGSYNFTRAAEYKNAENVVFIRGNPDVIESYRSNWQRHLEHAVPWAGRGEME